LWIKAGTWRKEDLREILQVVRLWSGRGKGTQDIRVVFYSQQDGMFTNCEDETPSRIMHQKEQLIFWVLFLHLYHYNDDDDTVNIILQSDFCEHGNLVTQLE
jgi:hypothetical protein